MRRRQQTGTLRKGHEARPLSCENPHPKQGDLLPARCRYTLVSQVLTVVVQTMQEMGKQVSVHCLSPCFVLDPVHSFLSLSLLSTYR